MVNLQFFRDLRPTALNKLRFKIAMNLGTPRLFTSVNTMAPSLSMLRIVIVSQETYGRLSIYSSNMQCCPFFQYHRILYLFVVVA